MLPSILATTCFGLLTGTATSIALLAAPTLLPKLTLLTGPFGAGASGTGRAARAFRRARGGAEGVSSSPACPAIRHVSGAPAPGRSGNDSPRREPVGNPHRQSTSGEMPS